MALRGGVTPQMIFCTFSFMDESEFQLIFTHGHRLKLNVEINNIHMELETTADLWNKQNIERYDNIVSLPYIMLSL